MNMHSAPPILHKAAARKNQNQDRMPTANRAPLTVSPWRRANAALPPNLSSKTTPM
jgi:hypothetical protein